MSQYSQKIQEAESIRNADIIEAITTMIQSKCKNQAEIIAGAAHNSGYTLTAVENVLKANKDNLWDYKHGAGRMSRARIYRLISK